MRTAPLAIPLLLAACALPTPARDVQPPVVRASPPPPASQPLPPPARSALTARPQTKPPAPARAETTARAGAQASVAALLPAPIPVPVQPDPDPEMLKGMSPEALRGYLGPPQSTSKAPPAETWRWGAGDCRLDVFLFPDLVSGGFKALAYEMAPTPEGARRCLARLRARHVG